MPPARRSRVQPLSSVVALLLCCASLLPLAYVSPGTPSYQSLALLVVALLLCCASWLTLASVVPGQPLVVESSLSCRRTAPLLCVFITFGLSESWNAFIVVSSLAHHRIASLLCFLADSRIRGSRTAACSRVQPLSSSRCFSAARPCCL